MGKKILPFEENPVITSYPHYSFMCSMIQTKPNGLEWIFQTYTQLIGFTRHEDYYHDARLNFYPWAGMHDGDLWNICPYIDKMIIPRRYFLQQKSRVNFVKNWINRDKYLCVYVDEFFRDDIQEIGQYYHPLFIFGYDDDNQVLYCADCFEGWKYGIKQVKYTDFELASTIDFTPEVAQYAVQVYTLNDHIITPFSIEFFKQQLYDYLMSEMQDYYLQTQYPNQIKYYPENNRIEKVYYGISSYDVILDVIQDLQNGVEYWNAKFLLTPDFRLIRDRAELMLQRYNFLSTHFNFEKNEILVKQLQEQVQAAMILENLLLKFVVSNRIALLDKIKNRLLCFIEQEKNITQQLLHQLGGIDE